VSNAWELICHHTYSGTPGVVYDQSPNHYSHGQALGIGATNFVKDGKAPGSGALRIREDGQRIWIPPGPGWWPLGGLRVEMTVRLDSQTAGLALHLGGHARWLMSGYRFQFGVSGRNLFATFSQAPNPGVIQPPVWTGPNHGPVKLPKPAKTPPYATDTVRTELHSLVPNFAVPFDRWVTLGFLHDGLTKIELSVDGVVVARTTPRWAVLPDFGVCIGNTTAVEFPLVGLVDEVSVWRLDPERISKEFFNRPMDESARQCWEAFFEWLRRWREENPDCADELSDLVGEAVRAAARRMAGAQPDRAADAQGRYADLWHTGRMGSAQMAALLDDYAAELAADGVDLTRDDAYRDLQASDCYRRFVSEMPSLDCDPEFAAYLNTLRGSGGERSGV
jgi:hypothetical protein